MKVSCHLMLIVVACALVGIARPEPTLDEIIDSLPDEWGDRRSLGIASNNSIVLNRKFDLRETAGIWYVIAIWNCSKVRSARRASGVRRKEGA